MPYLTQIIRNRRTLALAGVAMMTIVTASCGGGSSGATDSQVRPQLTVSASDNASLVGGECVTLKSAAINKTGPVAWSLDNNDAGTLSASTGDSVIWCPPASSSTATDRNVRIQARTGDITEAISLTLYPPAGLYPIAGDINAESNPTASAISGGTAIAAGKNGKLYVNDRIRKAILEISADGSANPYVVESASFEPTGKIVTDHEGNLYVASWTKHRIFKIGPNREISTLAGSLPGFADGAGESAQFRGPNYMTGDAAGNLYVSGNVWDKRIRKVTPDGKVTTIAGTCTLSFAGSDQYCMMDFKDGPRDEARIYLPSGIAMGQNGILYVADSNTIRKIDPAGHVTTVAGNREFGNVDGVGQAARFGGITNISVDENGTVYAIDSGNASIRKITADGKVSTIARIGTAPSQSQPAAQGVPTDIIATSPHTLLVLTLTSVQRLVF